MQYSVGCWAEYAEVDLDGCTTNDARSGSMQMFPTGRNICSLSHGELGVVTDDQSTKSHVINDHFTACFIFGHQYLGCVSAHLVGALLQAMHCCWCRGVEYSFDEI